MSAQQMGHDPTCLCKHTPSIQYVSNSELHENATYEIILYFTYQKNIKIMQFGIMKEHLYARLVVSIIHITAYE